MTQYDPSNDVLGTLLKRNSLNHIDELTDRFVKVVILIRAVKRKVSFAFEAKSIEVVFDHNEITYHATKVI